MRKKSISLFAGVLAMLIYTGCSTTAPNPEAVALKPTILDSIDYALPASFYGCWEGTIDSADSVTPLNRTGNHLHVERNTYQLCYRRRPASGGELVLTKFEFGGNNLDVISFENHVTAVDEGRRTARLRNHVLTEQGHNLLWVLPAYAREDIYADEDIAMKSDDLIAMSGKELIQVNGTDSAIVTFHGDFHRVPDKT
ncbi:MAG: hypothetical protein WBQ86_25580 [Candidatus Binatus sp.]